MSPRVDWARILPNCTLSSPRYLSDSPLGKLRVGWSGVASGLAYEQDKRSRGQKQSCSEPPCVRPYGVNRIAKVSPSNHATGRTVVPLSGNDGDLQRQEIKAE